MADVLQGLADRILELEEVGTDSDFENKTSAVTLTSGAVTVSDIDNKESLMVSKVKDGSKTGRFVPVSETEMDEIIKREKNKNTSSYSGSAMEWAEKLSATYKYYRYHYRAGSMIIMYDLCLMLL